MKATEKTPAIGAMRAFMSNVFRHLHPIVARRWTEFSRAADGGMVAVELKRLKPDGARPAFHPSEPYDKTHFVLFTERGQEPATAEDWMSFHAAGPAWYEIVAIAGGILALTASLVLL
ncbi:MAG: hypothetical protein V1790_15620 [Planctomycetota bacterium]